MKIILSLLVSCIFTLNLHAVTREQIDRETKDQIEVALKLGIDANGERLNTEPKITILDGQKSTIRVARELRLPAFAAGSETPAIDVGIILEMQAKVSGDKITYSGYATVREFKGGKSNTADGKPASDQPNPATPEDLENHTAYFKTIEIVLAGKAKPNVPIAVKFDDGLTASLTFKILNPDGSPKKL